MEQQSRQGLLTDDHLIDDIEAKIFTETLLGELGSSHKEHDSGDDDLNFLDADSGASDRGGKQSWIEIDDINLRNQVVRRSQEPQMVYVNLSDEETKEPPIQSEPIEAEISSLLGSIKVRASGIKATLLKTKSQILTIDKVDYESQNEDAPDLNLSIIEIKDRAAMTIEQRPDDLVNTSVDINDILLTELKAGPKPEASAAITFTLD